MANEARLHTNFTAGLIADNPLVVGATSLNSSGLAKLPIIDSSSHAAITIDPDGVGGEPEIVWVTNHAASSSTATILRAQEGTVAREHLRDTPWVHTATVRDFQNTLNTVASSGLNVQLTSDNIQDITLTDNATYQFPSAVAGVPASFMLIQRQDATGGWNPLFPASVIWDGGTQPVWSSTANAIDTATFMTVDGGTTWFGYVSGLGMA